MKFDTTVIKGDADKPAVIFIHGLGMDKRIWVSPDDAGVLGGRFPVGLLLCEEPKLEVGSKGLFFPRSLKNLKTLFHDFKELGYTVVAWSQKRPSAEIDIAVPELRHIVDIAETFSKAGTVLIGHSRGGLIARRYLECRDKRVKALVTLATPHRGSRMAQWAGYLSPFISAVKPLLSGSEKGTLTYTVRIIFDFLTSKAVKELLPYSAFFKTLDNERPDGVYYISFGGNDPTIFCAYRAVVERIYGEYDDRGRLEVKPQRVFSIPDIFESIIPARFFPDEMKKGYGDGLVSVESSKLQWGDEHYNFEVNHAGILFDKAVRAKVMDILSNLL